MELPRLLSLVQAVPVKVSLRVEVVMSRHLLVQTKVLHPHCLQNIRRQSCFKRLQNRAPPSSFCLDPLQLNSFAKIVASNLLLTKKKAFGEKLPRLTPVRGQGQGKEETIGRN